MGRSLRLKVLAEGVETREQFTILREMGCELVQGYHFSRPLPPDELVAFLRKHPFVGKE
jgi:EAL domain-containing protein (putative c-di-GMP-specific phosphodiesterase class I)